VSEPPLGIGLIGCGNITRMHLGTYQRMGLPVTALADLNREAAEERRAAYYPEARVYTSAAELLQQPDIEVVDIALHPKPRGAVIRAALEAGKHVLSQKPFSLDLDEAEALVDLAGERGLKLAVNQNIRWAPHARFLQLAVKAGWVGTVQTVSILINWDHSGIRGKAFETIRQIILYDFGIHWVDLAVNFFGEAEAKRASACVAHSLEQDLQPPMLAGALLTFPNGHAVLSYDALQGKDARESIIVTGSQGVLRAEGPLLGIRQVSVDCHAGAATVPLEGAYLETGFAGTMGALLQAIEAGSEPEHSGRNNLRTLEAMFAIVGAAETGRTVSVGSHRRLGPECEARE